MGKSHPSNPVSSIRAAIAIVLASVLTCLAAGAAAQVSDASSSQAKAGAHRSLQVAERRKPRDSRRYRTRRTHGGPKKEIAPEPEPAPAPAPAPTSEEPAPQPEPAPAPAPEEPAPAPAPAPAPQPAPTPVPSTDVLFQATKLSDFWLIQSAPGGVSEAPDPAGSGRSVFKLVVKDSDVYPVTPTENPRAEMLSPSNIRAGQEFWFASRFYLPSTFPSSLPGWMNVMQGPYGYPWNGPPPWHIEINGSSLRWTRNSTYGWDVPWQTPLVRGSWVSVMVHERFGEDGWIEMWINGQPITFFAGGTYNPKGIAPTQHLAMKTMDKSNNQGTNSVYLQSYRKLGMLSSITSYAGPLTIGKTRASVGG